MILCDVVGNVVMSEKNSSLVGEKIMMVKALDGKLRANGESFLAIDRTQCGIGDRVLVLREGSGVRQILGRDQGLPVAQAIRQKVPIKSMVVGIVDKLDGI